MRFSFWQVPNFKNSEFPYLRNKVCKMHFVLCISNNNNNPINGILQCSTILTNIKFKKNKNKIRLDLFCFTPIPIKSNKYNYKNIYIQKHTQYIIAWDPTTKIIDCNQTRKSMNNIGYITTGHNPWCGIFSIDNWSWTLGKENIPFLGGLHSFGLE
jgi:hypothetical protein